jgi:hypothetical protein
MLGTGLTFGAGVGVVASIVAGIAWLAGRGTAHELLGLAGRFGVVAFLLGVAFSGILAIAARGRHFSKLSLRLVGSLGAGAGVLYWVFLAMNGGRTWSPRDAVANFVLLLVMGAGSATATLLIARRARSALTSGDELDSLAPGSSEVPQQRRESKVKVPRV